MGLSLFESGRRVAVRVPVPVCVPVPVPERAQYSSLSIASGRGRGRGRAPLPTPPRPGATFCSRSDRAPFRPIERSSASATSVIGWRFPRREPRDSVGGLIAGGERMRLPVLLPAAAVLASLGSLACGRRDRPPRNTDDPTAVTSTASPRARRWLALSAGGVVTSADTAGRPRFIRAVTGGPAIASPPSRPRRPRASTSRASRPPTAWRRRRGRPGSPPAPAAPRAATTSCACASW